MTEAGSELQITRILVPLDTSEHSVAALTAAIDLAAKWHAELLGLFVEDVNLLNFAALPFSREISLLPAGARDIDILLMEKALKAQAERCRRLLEAQANAAHLRWSFQISRGHIASELLSRVQESDLIIMGRAGTHTNVGRRLGSTALNVCSQSSCSVVLVQPGMELTRPVAVLFDGSPASERGLALAARLAQADDKNLTVLIPAGDDETAQQLINQADQRLKILDINAQIVRLTNNTAWTLNQAVQAQGSRMLVLNADAAPWQDETGRNLLIQEPYPVMLVR